MNPVAEFEAAFADYVGAKYAIALCNGTATLHTALAALGVRPGDKVAVPPLTMSATTIAVLHARAVPVFVDVDPRTWLMRNAGSDTKVVMPVSLYGLHQPWAGDRVVDDAAQTLRPHFRHLEPVFPAFTSYSFQASKILALGEGGMLVTDSEDLAARAREFSSLGYKMDASRPAIRKDVLKHPTHARHWSLGWNYRMSPQVGAEGAAWFKDPSNLGETMIEWHQRHRREAADMYRDAVQDCDWLTPQHVPDGWTHDHWTYAVATDTPERCLWLLDAMERHGGERPYPAWRLTYNEPAFQHLIDPLHSCPVAEDLQPRLVQFQTNCIQSAERNAEALRRCIDECT